MFSSPSDSATLITTVANATVVTKGEKRGPDTMRGLGLRCATGGEEENRSSVVKYCVSVV